MGGFSLWHWIVVLLIVLVLFGRGRVADIMGEFGKGLKNFKQGVADEETKPAAPPAAQIPAPPSQPAAQNGETVADTTNKTQ